MEMPVSILKTKFCINELKIVTNHEVKWHRFMYLFIEIFFFFFYMYVYMKDMFKTIFKKWFL